MKRIYSLIVVWLFVGMTYTTLAQTRIVNDRVKLYQKTEKKINKYGLRSSKYDGVYHMVGAYVEGSYSAFIHNVEDYQCKPGGYGLGAGINYAYQNGRLLVQTGLGIRWQEMKGTVSDKIGKVQYYFPHLYDTQGTEFNLQYDFFSRTDISRHFYLTLPIMVGGYIYKSWYILGGLKAQLQLAGSTKITAVGSTTATYERYIDILEEMDNHGYRKNVPLEREGKKLDLGIDVMACLEMGYEWSLVKKVVRVRSDIDRYDYRLRLAAFCDFGILNICPSISQKSAEGLDVALYGIPSATRYDFATYTMNHVLMTPNASSKQVRNMFVGVRFTFLFGYRTKDRCLMCGSRGKTQYIYRR